MTTTGDVVITVVDNSAGIVVPSSTVQVVMGCSSSGTAATPIATKSAKTLADTFGYGPMVEAAALAILAGGTVVAVKTAQNAAGTVRGASSLTVSTTTGDTVNPIVVTTTTAHGLVTGDVVTIASVGGNTAANGTFVVTYVSGTTFSVSATGNGAYTSGGTVTFGGLEFTGTGTSKPSIALDGTVGAFDDYYAVVKVVTGGTVGSTGIVVAVSLDAGRNYGPNIAQGTATTLAIPNTGITLTFGSGTLVAGDKIYFSTIAPKWNTAGVSAAITALQASAYAVSGWGSLHIVGDMSAADCATIDGYLTTQATSNYIFTRAICNVVDASPPTQYGGTAVSDATWATAQATAFVSTSSKRMCVAAGHYNMPTAYPNAMAGAPRYRRPLSFALAARTVAIPPQRHAGNVNDGPLEQIVLDATVDPTDGFVYHDERINPTLDVGRLASAKTRIGLPGVFIVNPNLMSAAGSDFYILPLGAVMDIACDIFHTTGQKFINSDVRLNPNGTIYKNDAIAIQLAIGNALNVAMKSQGMISDYSVVVDQTANVGVTHKLPISGTITARGYIQEIDATLSLSNSLAAAAA